MQVTRGGRRVEISIFDIVVGDVLPLKIGDQVIGWTFVASSRWGLVLTLYLQILNFITGPCWRCSNIWAVPCNWWVQYDWGEQDCELWSYAITCNHICIYKGSKDLSVCHLEGMTIEHKRVTWADMIIKLNLLKGAVQQIYNQYHWCQLMYHGSCGVRLQLMCILSGSKGS